MSPGYVLGVLAGGTAVVVSSILGARWLNARIGSTGLRIGVRVVAGLVVFSAVFAVITQFVPVTQRLNASLVLIPPRSYRLVPSEPARARVQAAVSADPALEEIVEQIEARQIWDRRSRTVGAVGVMAIDPFAAGSGDDGYVEGLATASGGRPRPTRIGGHPGHGFRARLGPASGMFLYAGDVENLVIFVFGATPEVTRAVARSVVQSALRLAASP